MRKLQVYVLQDGCPDNAEAGHSRGMLCGNCKSNQDAQNKGISNQRQTDPVIRAKYKAQLAAWRLKNPRTRAATLFFAKNDPSDVSWLCGIRHTSTSSVGVKNYLFTCCMRLQQQRFLEHQPDVQNVAPRNPVMFFHQ